MQPEKFPLSKTVTQAPSLQLAHSAAPVVLRDKFIDLQPVCVITGVKKSTIYAWVKDPASDFPRPVRLSARMVRWSEAAVLQWVQNRINQAAGVQ
jgi:predicted DNA-binding transcriptional regulator AlpA